MWTLCTRLLTACTYCMWSAHFTGTLAAWRHSACDGKLLTDVDHGLNLLLFADIGKVGRIKSGTSAWHAYRMRNHFRSLHGAITFPPFPSDHLICCTWGTQASAYWLNIVSSSSSSRRVHHHYPTTISNRRSVRYDNAAAPVPYTPAPRRLVYQSTHHNIIKLAESGWNTEHVHLSMTQTTFSVTRMILKNPMTIIS